MSDKVSKKSTSSKFTGVMVMAFFAVTGVFYMLFSSAATPGTPGFGLYLSPSSANVSTGSLVNVKVYANMNNISGINSITAFLHYDPTQLQIQVANQDGSPSYPVKTWCTKLEGCKPEGEAVFTAGYSGTGTISPNDGILVGNMTFKALKTGTAAITFDTDPQLSGFSSTTVSAQTLNGRALVNGSYAIAAASSGGGSTGGSTGGSSGTTGTGSTTPKTSTSTKTGTSTTKPSGSGTTSTTSSTTSGGTNTTPTDNQNTGAPVGTTSDDTTGGDTGPTQSAAPVAQKKTSKALILAASMAVSAIVVGAFALLLSEPVRTKIAGIFHHGGSQFYQPHDPLVMGGPGSSVATPPHNLSSPSEPSENIVIKPTSSTTSGNEVPSSISSREPTPNPATNSSVSASSEPEDPDTTIIKPTQPPTA